MDKDHVLREIQRTANANGGKPLGRNRFFKETGIRENDWCGRYWRSWSDALREAGFTPNQLQSTYDATDLIERYVAVVRKLGTLPTQTDLQMERQEDGTFPYAKVFDRFGSKAQLVLKVRDYCRATPGYEDVVVL